MGNDQVPKEFPSAYLQGYLLTGFVAFRRIIGGACMSGAVEKRQRTGALQGLRRPEPSERWHPWLY
jgi:hypothetical protein